MTTPPQPRAAGNTLTRLGPRHLESLPEGWSRPQYDRTQVDCGIVHLGIGAFHRAHQAVYVDALLAQQIGPWGIVGVSLRSPAVRDALLPQGGLYTLVTRAAGGADYRVIGSVKSVLVAPENPEAVLRYLTDRKTRLVTLTVTEKGYCLAPSGRLDMTHPEILHDLKDPNAPKSAVGFLARALQRLRTDGAPPPTILSCDNLPSNGEKLRDAVTSFLAHEDDRAAQWVEREVAFPSSMVDGIVPATTVADLAEVREALGLDDRAAVVAEPFRQWVVEDRFAAGMPPLRDAGVEITHDVAAYERLKLRMLNGCHSATAYLGQLAGFEYIADALADPSLRRYLEHMMADEIAPTLAGFTPERLREYGAELIRRFENPAIRHRTWQISMDGSQKLPQRLIGTIADRLRAGAGATRLTLAVAAWLRFLGGADDAGRAIKVSDPRAAELMNWASGQQPEKEIVDNIVEHSGLFPPELISNQDFRKKVIETLSTLRRLGAKAALKQAAYGGA